MYRLPHYVIHPSQACLPKASVERAYMYCLYIIQGQHLFLYDADHVWYCQYMKSYLELCCDYVE